MDIIKQIFVEQMYQLMSEESNIKFENIPEHASGVIFVCNHINFSDFALLGKRLNFKLIYLSDTLNSLVPGMTSTIENLIDLIPYRKDRSSKGLDGNEIKQEILRLTSEGQNVLVFPEGEFSLNSKSGLKPFKNGLFYLSHEHSIPIIPIVISYSTDRCGNHAGEISCMDFIFEKANIVIKCLDTVNPRDFNCAMKYKEHIRDAMKMELSSLNFQNEP